MRLKKLAQPASMRPVTYRAFPCFFAGYSKSSAPCCSSSNAPAAETGWTPRISLVPQKQPLLFLPLPIIRCLPHFFKSVSGERNSAAPKGAALLPRLCFQLMRRISRFSRSMIRFSSREM